MSRLAVVLVVAVVLPVLATHQFDEIRATQSSCQEDVECRQNAYCQQSLGFCLCQVGYVAFEDLCLPVAKKLGDKCVAYIQCQVAFGEDAACIRGECQCVAGSHFAEGLCHTSVTIGERCAGRSDCYSASGVPVSCVHSVCQCHQEYHPNAAGNDCVRSISLGGTCTRNEECVVNNSMCYNTCSCQASFVPSADKQRCLPVAQTLGDPCEVPAQCTQFLSMSTCGSDGTCVCQRGAHQQDAKCWTSCTLGGVCEVSQQCRTASNVPNSVQCDPNTKRCVCAPGFVASRDDCVSSAPAMAHISTSLTFLLVLLYLYVDY